MYPDKTEKSLLPEKLAGQTYIKRKNDK